MNDIAIKQTSNSDIEADKTVTVYYTPNFIQITDVENQHIIGYKRLSKNAILNVRTGEVKEVTNNNNGCRSIDSLRKTFSKLSLLIHSNYYGNKTECFISLSYGSMVSEYEELKRDIKNLWSRFHRRNKERIPFRCLILIEYQQNGNPHLHLLLKRLDGCTLTTEYTKKLLDWSKGTIEAQRLYDANGLAEYLNPFKVSKKRERLRFYKRGQQVYRCYGQFVRPQKLRMSADEAMRLVVNNQLAECSSKAYTVMNDNEIVNHIIKKSYKKGDFSNEIRKQENSKFN